MPLIHYATIILLGAIWGGSFVFIRVAAPALGPFALVDARVLLAAAALGAWALLSGERFDRAGVPLRRFLVLGAVNAAIPFSLIATAELVLPASLAAILNATTPLLTALVAAVWLGERVTRQAIVGLALGAAGVMLVVGWSPLTLDPPTLLAVGASLLAAACYAVGGVYAARSLRGPRPTTLAFGQQLSAGVVLLAPATATLPARPPTPETIFAVTLLATLCTAFAYVLYFRLIAAVGPTRTLSVTYLVPAFGVLWGGLALGEAIGTGTVLGLVVILLGVWIVVGAHTRAKESSDVSDRPAVSGEQTGE